MKTLISMTDFVLQFDKPVGYFEDQSDFLNCQVDYMGKVMNYAQFLKQPLKLEMFIPCDDEGNFFEEPKIEDYFDDGFNFEFNQKHFKDVVLKEYYKAKEKVLFEGIEFERIDGVNFLKTNKDIFAFHDFNIKFKDLTVENLVQYNLQLTENAIKQIVL